MYQHFNFTHNTYFFLHTVSIILYYDILLPACNGAYKFLAVTFVINDLVVLLCVI